MPHDRLDATLSVELASLRKDGTGKGQEAVVTEVIPAARGRGRCPAVTRFATMPRIASRVDATLSVELASLRKDGTGKGQEAVVTEVIPAARGRGQTTSTSG